MHRLTKSIIAAALIVIAAAAADAQPDLGRIYGKVTVTGGDVYEGRIIWGDHETIWYHSFNAEYDFFDHNRTAYWRQREYRGKRPGSLTAQFTVFFGDIKTIDRKGSSRAVIMLKDDREFEVYSDDVNETVEILDKGFGKVTIPWRDLYLVQFMNEPDDYQEYSDDRAYPIYGSVLTRGDETFSGFITWDNDETLSTHVLEGEEGKYDRAIPFSRIVSIRPHSRSASEVRLLTGSVVTLSGSNDVDSGNRGIIVSDAEYGIISIPWKEVEEVTFDHNVPGLTYSSIKSGTPLRGTVYDVDGKVHSGYIRWDDDENMSIDFLNGETYDYTVYLRFENIREIRRRTRNSSIVLMKNGREMRLSGSNDVDQGNKGIVVLKKPGDEEGVLLDWDDFDKVVFRQ